MMGWLIALVILAGLAILPLGVSLTYNAQGLRVFARIGPVRIHLYPATRKEKPKEKKSAKTRNKPQTTQMRQKEQGGKPEDFLPLLRTVLDLIFDLRKKMRLKRLEVKLIMAGDDPCDLAVNYGRAWAALGNLMPHLENLFVIKKRNLEVLCDFTADQTQLLARADFTLTLARAFHLGARHGLRALRQYLSIMKMRKGGAKI